MISLKNESVNLTGLSTKMHFAFGVAASIFLQFDKPMVITLANDGGHRNNSQHNRGDAIDIDTHLLTDSEALAMTHVISLMLGEDFDVMLEPTHLCIEYEPNE